MDACDLPDDRYEELFCSAGEHDYDPNDDYRIVVEHLEHPMLDLARGRAAQIAALPDTPFARAHVFPADLSGTGAVAFYCNGTYAEPVIVIDLDQIRSGEVIDHELRHAMQEAGAADDQWGDEADAESYAFAVLNNPADGR